MWKATLIFLFSISPFLIASGLLYMKDPPVWPDEPVLYDTAKHILDKGYMATDLYGGEIKGLEKRALWYPPVFFYLYAPWVKIIGPRIELLRLFPLFLAVESLAIFFFILKKLFGSIFLTGIGLFLISVDWTFINGANVARMDMLVFVFILSSMLAVLYKKYLMAGLFSALAVLTHPIGVIALFVSLMGLMSHMRHMSLMDKFKKMELVAAPVVLGISLWLLSNSGYLNLMKEQMAYQLSRKAANEYSIFAFYSELPVVRVRMIFNLISFILFLYFILKKKEKRDLFILGGFVVSFLVTLAGKDFWYLLFFEPFATLVTLSVLKRIRLKLWVIIFTAVPAIAFFEFLIKEKSMYEANSYDYYDYSGKILNSLSPKGSVFLANIPDPYFVLLENGLIIYEVPYYDFKRENYIRLLDKSDYILINMKPDPVIYKYIILNTAEKKEINKPGLFPTALIKLVPLASRVSVQ